MTDPCPHDSWDGIDQSDGPDKVWECMGCGVKARFEKDADGMTFHVPVDNEEEQR